MSAADQSFTEKAAEKKLSGKLSSFKWFANASVGRMQEMDIPGFYAFSVMPAATGKAGELIYLVGPERILTSGNEEDFTWLMLETEVGSKPNALATKDFFALFIRMKAGRRGVLLYKPDEHILLKPGQLAGKGFQPPSYYFDEAGAHFNFWTFDTDKYEPVFYSVTVDKTGHTQYQVAE